MKTTIILSTVFVLFAFSMHSFATNHFRDHSKASELVNKNIASFSIKYGRNKIIEPNQNYTDFQFTSTNKSQFKLNPPKGRNLEVIDTFVTMK